MENTVRVIETDPLWLNRRNKTGVLAFHFIAGDKTLRYQDKIKVEVGQTLEVTGTLEPCTWGLHGCTKPNDCINYLPKSETLYVCLVRLHGNILSENDKIVASRRTVFAMANIGNVFKLWGIWCAGQALKNELKCGRTPDKRSIAAVKIARQHLAGKASLEDLSAARSAARSAESAARSAWSAWSAADRKLHLMIMCLFK